MRIPSSSTRDLPHHKGYLPLHLTKDDPIPLGLENTIDTKNHEGHMVAIVEILATSGTNGEYIEFTFLPVSFLFTLM